MFDELVGEDQVDVGDANQINLNDINSVFTSLLQKASVNSLATFHNNIAMILSLEVVVFCQLCMLLNNVMWVLLVLSSSSNLDVCTGCTSTRLGWHHEYLVCL